jgi:hypothetical protein
MLQVGATEIEDKKNYIVSSHLMLKYNSIFRILLKHIAEVFVVLYLQTDYVIKRRFFRWRLRLERMVIMEQRKDPEVSACSICRYLSRQHE